jgi:hypothetical protein
VKTHLKKIIGMTPLTFEEMYMVLTQVEACLNSRSLSLLSNDSESAAGHFVIGQPPTSANLVDVRKNHLSRWELLQWTQQVFWVGGPENIFISCSSEASGRMKTLEHQELVNWSL